MRFTQIRCGIICLLLCGNALQSWGQDKTQNIWYFGRKWGLDFNKTPAELIQDRKTQFSGSGSCATICDSAGNLILYSDGNNIFDRLHRVVPFGKNLHGDSNTSQGTVIVKQPGTQNLFFVISADQSGLMQKNRGVNYSVVDMNLNNGFGQVVRRNIGLLSPWATERVFAVPSCSGEFYWIITHAYNSDSFYVFKLGKTGMDHNAVISKTGVVHSHFNGFNSLLWEARGFIKVNKQGNRLALAYMAPFLRNMVGGTFYGDTSLMELHEFDNATGKIKHIATFVNPDTLTFASGGYPAFGVEFSPNGKYVYFSDAWTIRGLNTIWQFDAYAKDSATFAQSGKIVATDTWGLAGSLSLAPDGKIYQPIPLGNSISCIENPNDEASKIIYSRRKIEVPEIYGMSHSLTSVYYKLGTNKTDVLPSQINSCNRLPIKLRTTHYYSGITWNTGDTGREISVNQLGKYWINLQDNCGNTVADTVLVLGFQPPKILEDNVTICAPEFMLSCGDSSLFKEWVKPATNQCTMRITESASYVAKYEKEGCVFYDTMEVFLNSNKFIMTNVITPNGDGKNDVLYWGNPEKKDFCARIYSRWGECVFETKNPNDYWNGKRNGKHKLPEGTFFYDITFRTCGSDKKNIKGPVFVID